MQNQFNYEATSNKSTKQAKCFLSVTKKEYEGLMHDRSSDSTITFFNFLYKNRQRLYDEKPSNFTTLTKSNPWKSGFEKIAIASLTITTISFVILMTCVLVAITVSPHDNNTTAPSSLPTDNKNFSNFIKFSGIFSTISFIIGFFSGITSQAIPSKKTAPAYGFFTFRDKSANIQKILENDSLPGCTFNIENSFTLFTPFKNPNPDENDSLLPHGNIV